MVLREELFEKYLSGDEQPLIDLIKHYEDMAKQNLTLRYDSNVVDFVAEFLQKNDEVIRKQPHYIDILIDLIVKNDLMLFGYHMLSNLEKYSNDNAKTAERFRKLTSPNELAGYNPDDYLNGGPLGAEFLPGDYKLGFIPKDRSLNPNQFSLDDKLRMLVVGTEEEFKMRPLTASPLFSPARHTKTALENNKDMIVANHARLIEIIIENKAVNFIRYILENFKEYSESYITNKESIGNLITRFARVIAAEAKGYEINHCDYYIRKIEEEMGMSLEEAHAALADAVNKTEDMSQKIIFLSQTPDDGLITSISGRIEELINSNNVEAALQFAEENLRGISRLQDAVLNSSVRRLMDFVISTNNPKNIYRLAKANRGGSYLLDALVKLDNPAYSYLFAAKIDNISLEDINKIVVHVIASNNTQFIGCLLWCLREKVQNKKYKFEDLGFACITLNKCLNGVDWFVIYDETTPDKLEKALLTDDARELAKFGMDLKSDKQKN